MTDAARRVLVRELHDEHGQPVLVFRCEHVRAPLRARSRLGGLRFGPCGIGVEAAPMGRVSGTELVDHVGVVGAEDMDDPRRPVLVHECPAIQDQRRSRRTLFGRNKNAAPGAAGIEGSRVILLDRRSNDVPPETAEFHTPRLGAGGRFSNCHAVPPHIGQRSGAIRELAP